MDHREEFLIQHVEGGEIGLVLLTLFALPLLGFLRWFVVLGFLTTSFLADWPVTKICCVAAQTSSSRIEYLFACLNRSSIVIGDFLERDSKNGVPGQILYLKI